MPSHRSLASSLPVALIFLAACSGGGSGAAPQQSSAPTSSPAAASEGNPKEVFKSRCAPCHGETGKGDGPGATALNPKPRNYTDKDWQKKVTDEDIKKTILYGGAAVGKSASMPASPDLEPKQKLLDGLVRVVRSFGE